jgi:hypothetical protein
LYNAFSFFQEAVVGITDATNNGDTVWELLHLRVADPAALASLLKNVLGEAPPAFEAKLSPENSELSTQGCYFHAQLPTYTFLEWQRAQVVEKCPLPAVLQYIVADYAAANPKDLWAGGLRTQVPWAHRLRVQRRLRWKI